MAIAMTDYSQVAVLVPCLNEELTIAKVVTDHLKALPGATVYVFDNRSTDRTAEVAAAAGAKVVPSPRRGKGNVVRHMFEAVDAEVYLMVDGDDTYPAEAGPALVAEVTASGAGMVVGARTAAVAEKSFRPFHQFGNWMISTLISLLFGETITDALSGHRAFSAAFARAVPLVSSGFEIETELTLQAISKRFGVREVPVRYGERPEGSVSKLNTWSDGYIIIKAILKIFKDFKPLPFFSLLSLLFVAGSLTAAVPPVLDFIRHQYVYHVPLAILASGLGIVAVQCFGIGLVLDSACKYHNENFELLRKLVQRDPGAAPPSQRRLRASA
jgi:glycosyltransferase involved in cell wall biosynthesis